MPYLTLCYSSSFEEDPCPRRRQWGAASGIRRLTGAGPHLRGPIQDLTRYCRCAAFAVGQARKRARSHFHLPGWVKDCTPTHLTWVGGSSSRTPAWPRAPAPRVSSPAVRPQSLTNGTYAARREARGTRPGPATYSPAGRWCLLFSRPSFPTPPLPCLRDPPVRAAAVGTTGFPGTQGLRLRPEPQETQEPGRGGRLGTPLSPPPLSSPLSPEQDNTDPRKRTRTQSPALEPSRPAPAPRDPISDPGRPAHFWPRSA